MLFQVDVYHRFEEQGPKFERLLIDIEHLDLCEYCNITGNCQWAQNRERVLAMCYGDYPDEPKGRVLTWECVLYSLQHYKNFQETILANQWEK